MTQYVQQWTPPGTNLSGGGGTISGDPTTEGSLLVARVVTRVADVNVTLADDAGNTWVEAGRISHGVGDGFIFYAANADPITTLTTTITDAADAPATANHWLNLAEFSGAATSSPLADFQSSAVSTAGAVPTPLTPVVTATPPEPGALIFGAYAGAVSNRTFELQPGFTGLNSSLGQQMTSLGAWTIADDTDPIGPQWMLTAGSAPGGASLTVAFAPAGPPAPEPEELALAAAAGGNPVGGTTLEVLSDDDDDTVVWTSDNPDGEVWAWTLPPVEPPEGDLTLPLRTTSTGGTGTIATEISGDGETWTAGPTIVCDGAPADRDLTFPAATIAGITEQQWQTGVQVRLTLTADS